MIDSRFILCDACRV